MGSASVEFEVEVRVLEAKSRIVEIGWTASMSRSTYTPPYLSDGQQRLVNRANDSLMHIKIADEINLFDSWTKSHVQCIPLAINLPD